MLARDSTSKVLLEAGHTGTFYLEFTKIRFPEAKQIVYIKTVSVIFIIQGKFHIGVHNLITVLAKVHK